MPANVETMFYVREKPWHVLGLVDTEHDVLGVLSGPNALCGIQSQVKCVGTHNPNRRHGNLDTRAAIVGVHQSGAIGRPPTCPMWERTATASSTPSATSPPTLIPSARPRTTTRTCSFGAQAASPNRPLLRPPGPGVAPSYSSTAPQGTCSG